MLKNKIHLIVFVFLVFSNSAFAGGDYSRIRILDFQGKGNDEYSIKFIQLSEPSDTKHKEDTVLTVHLRHNEKMFRRPDIMSKEKYLKAITLLKKQVSESKEINFGIISYGYAPIEGKANEFQSNYLEIYDDVVYSYPGDKTPMSWIIIFLLWLPIIFLAYLLVRTLKRSSMKKAQKTLSFTGFLLPIVFGIALITFLGGFIYSNVAIQILAILIPIIGLICSCIVAQKTDSYIPTFGIAINIFFLVIFSFALTFN